MRVERVHLTADSCPALATEVAFRGVVRTAQGTGNIQRRGALSAEFHANGIFSVTPGAPHAGSPQICRNPAQELNQL